MKPMRKIYSYLPLNYLFNDVSEGSANFLQDMFFLSYFLSSANVFIVTISRLLRFVRFSTKRRALEFYGCMYFGI